FFTMFLFFFNDTSPTDIYTLSLHDALPISRVEMALVMLQVVMREKDLRDLQIKFREEPFIRGHQARLTDCGAGLQFRQFVGALLDRKSTRLNSSHDQISYAVFCLKKKKKNQ